MRRGGVNYASGVDACVAGSGCMAAGIPLLVDQVPVGHLDVDDGDSAAGCVAFVPLQPLPPGSEIEIQWTLPDGVLGKRETFAPIAFSVR